MIGPGDAVAGELGDPRQPVGDRTDGDVQPSGGLGRDVARVEVLPEGVEQHLGAAATLDERSQHIADQVDDGRLVTPEYRPTTWSMDPKDSSPGFVLAATTCCATRCSTAARPAPSSAASTAVPCHRRKSPNSRVSITPGSKAWPDASRCDRNLWRPGPDVRWRVTGHQPRPM